MTSGEDSDEYDDPIRLIDFEQRRIEEICAAEEKHPTTQDTRHATPQQGSWRAKRAEEYDAADSDGEVLIQRNTNMPKPRKKVTVTLSPKFFDIPRNVKLLRTCIPLTVKVVKCDKYPSCNKTHIKHTDNIVVIDDDSDSDIKASNPVAKENTSDLSLSEQDMMKLKIRPVNTPYPILKTSSPKHKGLSEGKLHRKINDQTLKHIQEKVKTPLTDRPKIDFQKNQGLVGLKLTKLATVPNVKAEPTTKLNESKKNNNNTQETDNPPLRKSDNLPNVCKKTFHKEDIHEKLSQDVPETTNEHKRKEKSLQKNTEKELPKKDEFRQITKVTNEFKIKKTAFEVITQIIANDLPTTNTILNPKENCIIESRVKTTTINLEQKQENAKNDVAKSIPNVEKPNTLKTSTIKGDHQNKVKSKQDVATKKPTVNGGNEFTNSLIGRKIHNSTFTDTTNTSNNKKDTPEKRRGRKPKPNHESIHNNKNLLNMVLFKPEKKKNKKNKGDVSEKHEKRKKKGKVVVDAKIVSTDVPTIEQKSMANFKESVEKITKNDISVKKVVCKNTIQLNTLNFGALHLQKCVPLKSLNYQKINEQKIKSNLLSSNSNERPNITHRVVQQVSPSDVSNRSCKIDAPVTAAPNIPQNSLDNVTGTQFCPQKCPPSIQHPHSSLQKDKAQGSRQPPILGLPSLDPVNDFQVEQLQNFLLQKPSSSDPVQDNVQGSEGHSVPPTSTSLSYCHKDLPQRPLPVSQQNTLCSSHENKFTKLGPSSFSSHQQNNKQGHSLPPPMTNKPSSNRINTVRPQKYFIQKHPSFKNNKQEAQKTHLLPPSMANTPSSNQFENLKQLLASTKPSLSQQKNITQQCHQGQFPPTIPSASRSIQYNNVQPGPQQHILPLEPTSLSSPQNTNIQGGQRRYSLQEQFPPSTPIPHGSIQNNVIHEYEQEFLRSLNTRSFTHNNTAAYNSFVQNNVQGTRKQHGPVNQNSIPQETQRMNFSVYSQDSAPSMNHMLEGQMQPIQYKNAIQTVQMQNQQQQNSYCVVNGVKSSQSHSIDEINYMARPPPDYDTSMNRIHGPPQNRNDQSNNRCSVLGPEQIPPNPNMFGPNNFPGNPNMGYYTNPLMNSNVRPQNAHNYQYHAVHAIPIVNNRTIVQPNTNALHKFRPIAPPQYISPYPANQILQRRTKSAHNVQYVSPVRDGAPLNLKTWNDKMSWNCFDPASTPSQKPPPAIEFSRQTNSRLNQSNSASPKSLVGTTIIGENITGPIRKITINAAPVDTDKEKQIKPSTIVNSTNETHVTSKEEMLEELCKVAIISPPQSPKPASLTNLVNAPTITNSPEKNIVIPHCQPIAPSNGSPKQSGYSPPILPISTYKLTLQQLANIANLNRSADCNRTGFDKSEAAELKRERLPEQNLKRKLSLDDDKQDKSSKKISLDEYKRRASKSEENEQEPERKEGTYIKTEIKSEASEQDLGYASDSTIKM